MKYLIALASITFREVKGLQILENCASIKFRECPDNYDFAVINSHERPKYSRNRQTFYLQSSFNYQNNINGLSHKNPAVRLRLWSMVRGASLFLSITFWINLQKNIRQSHDSIGSWLRTRNNQIKNKRLLLMMWYYAIQLKD